MLTSASLRRYARRLLLRSRIILHNQFLDVGRRAAREERRNVIGWNGSDHRVAEDAIPKHINAEPHPISEPQPDRPSRPLPLPFFLRTTDPFSLPASSSGR